MTKRPAYSLLFIKSDLLARADFGPKLEPMGFWQQPQSGNVRLYYSIESALTFGGKCGRSVWVIGEEFWTQTLSLPASAMAGLSREQVHKAIGFDVEALTGVGGADSALGFYKASPTDQAEHYWVTQIAAATETQIKKAIESAGSSLAGMVHPGGLPAPVGADVDANFTQSWRRIEVWKDTTICIAGQSDRTQRVHVINGDVGQGAWRASVSRWIAANDADHSEWLGPQGTMAGEPLGGNAKPWAASPVLSGDVLKGWMTQWAKELIAGSTRVPIVEADQVSPFTQRRVAITVVLAILCLVACIGRNMWAGKQNATATRDLAAALAPKHELEHLEKQAADLRTDLARRRAQTAATPHATTYDPADIERQRYRLGDLLTALAKQSDGSLVINQLTPENNGVVLISGQCLPSTAIDNFTRRLAAVLPGKGWDVAPAEKLTSKDSTIDGPIQFRLRISPSRPAAANGPAVAASLPGGDR